MKKLLLPILFWGSLVALFLVLSTSVGLVATGYQFDWQNQRLTRTGLIYLAGSPRNVTVSINGSIVSNRLPVKLPTLFPGEYLVTIDKEGYASWKKTFSLLPGQARTESDILLFLLSPEVATVSDPELIQRVKNNTEASPLIDGNEIRFNNRLVTRVSGELLDAALSPNRSHVFFQVDKEIRVIETDGGNELVLFTIGSAGRSQLIVVDEAKDLIILDGDTVKRLRIRE